MMVIALAYAAFTHVGLTTRYRKKCLYKSIFCAVKVTQYIVYKR